LPAPLAVSLSLALDPGGRFALVDREGEEAVRYRRWWVRALRDEGSSAWVPRVSGCDLIVRDDIWSQISDLAQDDPYWAPVDIGAD
ncbi:MAG TPA: hypothetical protein VN764_03100, partial [Polyangiaceae bacterium]|nr:hypothetical protein [Polyangiaceae bacterium]